MHQFVVRFVMAAACVGVLADAHPAAFRARGTTDYVITQLGSLGGTSSRGDSINDLGWIAGFSNLAGDASRHATLWVNRTTIDLGTLGGPNSSVVWPVKNTLGVVAGITQTAVPDPLHENWSCSAFLPLATATGYQCIGFVWFGGVMRPLPTLGGTHGFATGVNDWGQIVGWAENAVHDVTCVAPQVLQFRAVEWQPITDRVVELPVYPGDTSSAATAINDRGQIVGISGICDQAVGRFTAAHAVMWDRGQVAKIGDLGGATWNTPMAINERGDVAGFASLPGDDPNNPNLRAFFWTKRGGIVNLQTLAGDATSQASGINAFDQIVGTSCPAAGRCNAFVWDGGQLIDLNHHIAGSYPYHLETAQDINDEGRITGRSVNLQTGERFAIVATPVR